MTEVTTEIVGLAIFVIVQIGGFVFWVATLAQKVKGIEKEVDERKKHGERLAALETKAGLWNTENIQSESPVSLTEKGRMLLKESGAEERIEESKERLLQHFENVDEPFDIQTKSMEIMEQELLKDKKVKTYLFQEGEKGIGKVAEVAGIALRDIVFKEKGIEV